MATGVTEQQETDPGGAGEVFRVGVLGAGAIGAYVGAAILRCPAEILAMHNIAIDQLETVLIGRKTLINATATNKNTITIDTNIQNQSEIIERNGGKVIIANGGTNDGTNDGNHGTEDGTPGNEDGTNNDSENNKQIVDKCLVTDDATWLKGCKVIVVAVKSTETKAAGEILRDVVGLKKGDDGKVLDADNDPNCVVISMQNGVGNAAVLASYIPGFPVLSCMVGFNVHWYRETNTFFRTTSGDLIFEGCNKKNHSEMSCLYFNVFTDLLRRTMFDVKVIPKKEIDDVLYGKLLINLANALNALSGVSVVTMLSVKQWRLIFAALIDEALLIYKLQGIKPKKILTNPKILPHVLRSPNWLYSCIQNSIAKADKEARSSMLQDVMHRTKTEIDFLNGEIVRLADEGGHGVNRKGKDLVPLNRKIVELVHQVEEKAIAGMPFNEVWMSANDVAKFIGFRSV